MNGKIKMNIGPETQQDLFTRLAADSFYEIITWGASGEIGKIE